MDTIAAYHSEVLRLRAALAQQAEPAQEPVGEMRLSKIIEGMVVPVVPAELPVGTKLYTAPPQRQDQRVEKLEAHRDALKQTLHDELAGNLRLRDLGGARPDEPMLTFLERIIAERDALLEALKEIVAATDSDEWNPVSTVKARAAIKMVEEKK